jgi:ABC-type glycerol-3-phosphate transport system substrate-binding protein
VAVNALTKSELKIKYYVMKQVKLKGVREDLEPDDYEYLTSCYQAAKYLGDEYMEKFRLYNDKTGIYTKQGIIRGICKWTLIAILVFTLTACSSNSNKIEDINFAEDFQPVELHFYTRGYGNIVEPVEKDEINNMLDEVAKELSESIKVVPVFHWIPTKGYEDKIQELVSSGEKIDAFTTFGTNFLVEKYSMKDITKLFPEYAQNYYNELISHSSGLEKLKKWTVNESLFAVPNNGLATERCFVIARKDLAEKYSPAGFETLDDYGKFLKNVQEEDAEIIPGNLDASLFFNTYMKGNGYFLFGVDWIFMGWDTDYKNEIYPMEQISAFVTAYDMIKSWKESGYIKQQSRINTGTYLESGELASALLSYNELESLNITSPEYEFIIDPLYTNSRYVSKENFDSVAISINSAHPNRVLMFLEWIHSSQESYDLFTYGIENRNYVMNGKKISLKQIDKNLIPINKRHSMDFFRDYRYERLYGYQPENYKEIVSDACQNNVMAENEVLEMILQVTQKEFLSFQEDEDKMGKLMNEQKNLQAIFKEYYANYYNLMNQINSGLFSKTSNEFISMQKDVGIDSGVEMIKRVIDIIK